jgi:murein tripeptide amidase MpaA
MPWPTDRFPTAGEILLRLAEIQGDARFSSMCSIHDFDNPTHENRPTKYLRIGRLDAGNANRNKVVLTGGIHAREWVPPMALTNLAFKLLEAKHGGSSISIGGAVFSATDVERIIEHVDLYIAPMINPDGYEHSRTSFRLWRKNRKPAPPDPTPDVTYIAPCAPGKDEAIGVDINRNFDVVWKFEDFYIADAVALGKVGSSDRPCDDQFRGIHAFSEAESKNVKFLLDKNPGFYCDCHMFGPVVFHAWGIEQNKKVPGVTPALNPGQVRDGTWPAGTAAGTPGFNDYKEPIGSTFIAEVRALAGLMADATGLATGRRYDTEPGAAPGALTGAADDYATSKNLGVSKPPIKAFTLECHDKFLVDFATEYHGIERELQAAVMALLRHAAVPPPSSGPPSTPSGGRNCFDCRG